MDEDYEDPTAWLDERAPVASLSGDAIGGGATPDLLALLAAYNKPTQYGEALRKRIAEQDARQAELEASIRNAYAQQQAGPSKSEALFRLSQAFLDPGRTGNFSEALGRAAGVGADYDKAQREAKMANAANQLAGAVELNKLRAAAGKEQVENLRALDTSERTDRRAVTGKLIESYIRSGQPQSQVGKEAVDAGLRPGTPEYTKFVADRIRQKAESGDLYKDAMLAIQRSNLDIRRAAEERAGREEEKLTPQERTELFDVRGKLSAAEASKKLLSSALDANKLAFGNNLPEQLQYKSLKNIPGVNKDPRVLATEQLEQLLTESALSGLRATFGGNPTEGERAIALLTEGMQASSRESRDALIKQALQMVEDQIARNGKYIEDLHRGRYRSYARPETSAEPASETPRADTFLEWDPETKRYRRVTK